MKTGFGGERCSGSQRTGPVAGTGEGTGKCGAVGHRSTVEEVGRHYDWLSVDTFVACPASPQWDSAAARTEIDVG
jgi:hypothetical protein